jgi:ferredoxin
MSSYKHSVTLDISRCKGCTNCIKRCPTEAIRVRDGHAIIKEDLCIDCGECIRVCPYQAKKATFDRFEDFADYKLLFVGISRQNACITPGNISKTQSGDSAWNDFRDALETRFNDLNRKR